MQSSASTHTHTHTTFNLIQPLNTHPPPPPHPLMTNKPWCTHSDDFTLQMMSWEISSSEMAFIPTLLLTSSIHTLTPSPVTVFHSALPPPIPDLYAPLPVMVCEVITSLTSSLSSSASSSPPLSPGFTHSPKLMHSTPPPPPPPHSTLYVPHCFYNGSKSCFHFLTPHHSSSPLLLSPASISSFLLKCKFTSLWCKQTFHMKNTFCLYQYSK